MSLYTLLSPTAVIQFTNNAWPKLARGLANSWKWRLLSVWEIFLMESDKMNIPHYLPAETMAACRRWRFPRGWRRSSKHHSPSWTSCTWCFLVASSEWVAWCVHPPVGAPYPDYQRQSETSELHKLALLKINNTLC